MSTEIKLIEELTVFDIIKSPVWKYVNSDEIGETAVKPVRRLPVKTLTAKIVGTQVRLENGDIIWALIGNVDTTNARLTEHFLTLSLENNGKWFTLARYHDLDYLKDGPEALAAFLGMSIDQVYPIAYDLTKYVVGEKSTLIGQVLKEPRERLSRAEIMALAVP